ncbi:unnamed protein product [Lactuca saligna]|uniref:Uncharacterized protein n=1 Tax=Lactuca saligna TaxID=75948 RepID=A0AA36A2B4_LACSI|nr:unnamed protein product [Lactuca saligna]
MVSSFKQAFAICFWHWSLEEHDCDTCLLLSMFCGLSMAISSKPGGFVVGGDDVVAGGDDVAAGCDVTGGVGGRGGGQMVADGLVGLQIGDAMGMERRVL